MFGTQTVVMNAIGDGCLTTDAIAKATGFVRPQVYAATGKLLARGYAERREIGCFALTEAGRAAFEAGCEIGLGPIRRQQKPRRMAGGASLRQRAWNVMAIMRSFTIPDLVTAAARVGDRQPDDNLRRFCRALVAAGYLQERPQRLPDHRPNSNGHKVFLIIKHTGPIAPSYRSTPKVLWDHNTCEEVAL